MDKSDKTGNGASYLLVTERCGNKNFKIRQTSVCVKSRSDIRCKRADVSSHKAAATPSVTIYWLLVLLVLPLITKGDSCVEIVMINLSLYLLLALLAN